jgi:hypothetical protein
VVRPLLVDVVVLLVSPVGEWEVVVMRLTISQMWCLLLRNDL